MVIDVLVANYFGALIYWCTCFGIFILFTNFFKLLLGVLSKLFLENLLFSNLQVLDNFYKY